MYVIGVKYQCPLLKLHFFRWCKSSLVRTTGPLGPVVPVSIRNTARERHNRKHDLGQECRHVEALASASRSDRNASELPKTLLSNHEEDLKDEAESMDILIGAVNEIKRNIFVSSIVRLELIALNLKGINEMLTERESLCSRNRMKDKCKSIESNNSP